MGCRKADIEKYTEELEYLNTALEAAQQLVKYTGNVKAGLSSLQGYYADTVTTSDEFINEFHVLDQDADTNASSIQTKIEDAIEELEEMLKQAQEEEESCEEHNG